MPSLRAASASRSRQTGNQASANRIVAQYEYDWDHRRCLLYRRSTAVIRQNDVDLEPDKLGRKLGSALAAPFRPSLRDRDGATFNPAEFA